MPSTPAPTSPRLLLERIARRGRGFERTFTPEFLAGLARSYRDVAASAACPVIEVDVSAVDITAPEGRALVERIREVLP